VTPKGQGRDPIIYEVPYFIMVPDRWGDSFQ